MRLGTPTWCASSARRIRGRPGGASSAAVSASVAPSPCARYWLPVPSFFRRSGVQRAAAEPLQAAAVPVAAELEAALALRRTGAEAKALRRVLRRIEELLDE